MNYWLWDKDKARVGRSVIIEDKPREREGPTRVKKKDDSLQSEAMSSRISFMDNTVETLPTSLPTDKINIRVKVAQYRF